MQKFFILSLVSLLFLPSVFAKDLRFAQVTDVKYQKSDENSSLENVINDINQQKSIEFVVFTGDNISRPDKENLKAFISKAKKLNCPFYIVIGDKDVNKRKGLSKLDYAKFVNKHIAFYAPKTPNYVFQKKGVVFVVVDGAKDVIPSTIGYYKDDMLNWLDNVLTENSTKPVIILQHFPIVPPSNKENYATYKSEHYLNLISNHKNVKAVISGHYGVNKEQDVNGVIHVSTAPCPSYRIIDFIDFDTPTSTLWAEVKVAK